MDPNSPVVPPAAPEINPPAPAVAPGAPAPAEDPGRTLGIVGLVLAFFVPIAGIIVSYLALQKSKAAGIKNTLALVGLILSIIFFILGILYVVGILVLLPMASVQPQ